MTPVRHLVGCRGHSARPACVCPRDRFSDPYKPGRPGRVGEHGCCCTALAAMMVVSLSGPWSGPEASPALQRDTSKMVKGPAQQPLQDFKLRTLLKGEQQPSPLVFPAFFMHSYYFFHWVEGWRVTLSLIDTKLYVYLP